MSLSIIIPVYNNWHLTKSCLKDLALLPEDHEIIVVDDASQDRTKGLEHFLAMDEVAGDFNKREYHPNIKVIRNEKNRGFAYSVNRGYKESTKDVICFLNNDIRVDNSAQKIWSKILIEKANKDCVIGPTVCLLDSDFHYKMNLNKIPNKGFFYLSGWCLAANRKTWEKLREDKWDGPWETKFKTFYEDGDLSFRMREMGISFCHIDIKLKHLGHMTTKKLNITDMYLKARQKFINKWTNERIEKMIKKPVLIL